MEKVNEMPAHGKPIAFTIKDGTRILGLFKGIANPCGDYWNNEDYFEAFFTENEGNSYKADEVVSWRYVSDIQFFYKETENGEYVPLKVEKSENITWRSQEKAHEHLQQFFDSRSNLELPKLEHASLIRSWLLLNTECSDDIYIDEKGIIHTDGIITLLDPGYIKIRGNK